jgi:hypothetical protein
VTIVAKDAIKLKAALAEINKCKCDGRKVMR